MSEVKIGGSFFNEEVPANTSATVVTAAQNAHGVSIRTATLSCYPGGTCVMYANFPDGTQRPLIYIGGTSIPTSVTQLPNPLFVPAGIGLTINAQITDCGIAMTYDLYSA